MKVWILLDVFFIVSISTIALGGDQGLINLVADYNPSFEEDNLSHWNVESGKVTIDYATKASGERSVKIEQVGFVSCEKIIEVEPGYKYCMSVNGKLQDFRFVNSKYGCGFGLRQLREDKSVNGNWYDMQEYIKYYEGNSDWEYVEKSWVPKQTTKYLMPVIHVDALPGSIVWVDDVKIWKVPIKDKSSLFHLDITENGSFEVRYESGKMPFGFHVSVPDDYKGDVFERVCGVDKISYDRSASLAVYGKSKIESSVVAFNAEQIDIQVAIKLDGVEGEGAFAQVWLLDKDRQLVKKIHLVDNLDGSEDWKVIEEKNVTIPSDVCYAKWLLGSNGIENGTVYFDDLRILVPTVYKKLDQRPFDNKKAVVQVDCTKLLREFISPLNSYDHHCSDRVNSWSIGTAGEHLEGPERWHLKKKDFGIKYIRVHDGYNGNLICQHLPYDKNYCYYNKHDDKTGLSFKALRTNFPQGDMIFPPVCTIDEKSGEMITDFSSIKHYLDNSILKGGSKPIFGLEPVPSALALEGNSHYKPRDMKLWEEFNYRFITFLVDTYGKEEVLQWIFETGNEPGTHFCFHGRPNRTPETILSDFLEMQDYTIAGCMRALPDIFIAGPSGPPESFFIPMLEHCAVGTNYATGKKGTKIDAISYHGYLGGTPEDMSWRQAEDQILRMQSYVDHFYKLSGKKIQLFNTEWTAIYHELTELRYFDMHASEDHRQAIGSLHVANISHKLGVDMLTFFFFSPIFTAPVRGSGQDYPINQLNCPEFFGKETMISFHGIFKPICRSFEMLSWLNGMTEIYAESSNEPIYSLAAKKGNEIKVLCYSFDVNPQVKYNTSVDVKINIDAEISRVKVKKYEFSGSKANSAYLCQSRRITQADCENDLSIVDEINSLSRLVPEDMGCYNVVNGNVSIPVDMTSFSAVMFSIEM